MKTRLDEKKIELKERQSVIKTKKKKIRVRRKGRKRRELWSRIKLKEKKGQEEERK